MTFGYPSKSFLQQLEFLPIPPGRTIVTKFVCHLVHVHLFSSDTFFFYGTELNLSFRPHKMFPKVKVYVPESIWKSLIWLLCWVVDNGFFLSVRHYSQYWYRTQFQCWSQLLQASVFILTRPLALVQRIPVLIIPNKDASINMFPCFSSMKILLNILRDVRR